MHIDLDRVLWRTRGCTWDYVFVLRPGHPNIENPYAFHADVFSGITPSIDPSTVGGVLRTLHGEEIPFLATAFQDADSKDEAGRPVAHYIAWFPNVIGKPSEYEVLADWGEQVVRELGDYWRSAFRGSGASQEDLLASARTELKEVVLREASGIHVSFNRQVVEKKKPTSVPRSSGSNRALRVIAAVGALLLALLVYWLNCR